MPAGSLPRNVSRCCGRCRDPEVWTKERFLAWADARSDDVRYEFDGFRPVAMAPATLAHNAMWRATTVMGHLRRAKT